MKLKSDVILLTYVIEKIINASINDFGNNPLCSLSLPGFTWQCRLNYTGINFQTLQHKDMILLFGSNVEGGKSSAIGNK